MITFTDSSGTVDVACLEIGATDAAWFLEYTISKALKSAQQTGLGESNEL